MNSQDRADVMRAYEGYLTAFANNDIDTINTYIKYPLAYIGADTVTLLGSFPIDPAEMKKAKGWKTSEAIEIDVVAVGENKAHMLMHNARRLRADGSLIEEATGFYAYRKTADGWKMFAFSDIVFPT